jgi:PTS system nitrogen regulatory IIA component
MQIVDLIAPARVVADARTTSKKRLLEQLAKMLDERGAAQSERAIFESLCRRERLGTTALGQGVALPHGRCAEVSKPVGAFLRLAEPVPFDAPDAAPVDLVFALVVPEHFTDQHLSLLAEIAQLFSHGGLTVAIRRARSAAEIYQLLSSWHEHPAAA